MIKAVIFDLFETLITERIHTPYDRLSVAQRISVDEQVFRNEWCRIQKDRMTSAFHDYASALTSICDSLECNIDQSMIRQLENERIARFSMIFINPDPDIIDALKEIRRLDIKTGLVSNASPDEIAAWNGCLVHSFIDASVFSCEVGCMKPDPAIFLMICEKLVVEPHECVYIGDGSFGELSGAAELGMTAYCAAWFYDRWPDIMPDDISISEKQYPKLPTISSMVTEIRRVVNQK